MASPSSRLGLVNYCLRSLGSPVIEINVDDDQINDRVDEAIQFYREYHSDAVVRQYRKHQLTTDDIANKYIDLPESLLFVSRVWPLVMNSSTTSSMWSARYQLHLNDIYDLRQFGSMVNYEMTRQYLEMLDMMLNGTPASRFNRHLNRLFMDISWGEMRDGDYVIVEGYETVDPCNYTDIYNDMFLKRYTTALIKRQWGQNLSKFEGMQLPGGVTMNGRQILDDANAEIDKLEAEMESRYAFPPDFYVG